MNFPRSLRWTRRIIAGLLLCLSPAVGHADLWRTAYYPGWEQTSMAASNIDFAALTHIIHFSVVPKADGTLDYDLNVMATNYSRDIVTRAHAAGVKVLISVGGGSSETLFQGATSSAHLPVFINNLTNFMARRGYDGIDIDWEPFPVADARQYTNLVLGLRAALDEFPEPKLITVAAAAYPPTRDPATNNEYNIYAAIQDQLDQINVMTYDLSGPFEGWVTWFNSPLYGGGYRFASSGGLIPSVEGSVSNFLAHGVASTKLGIGLPFYGDIWTGGTGYSPTSMTQPRQLWIDTPTMTACSYHDLMTNHFAPESYHWDTNAQAAYFSVTNAKPAKDIFVSYDDARACQAKVNYARNRNLGGIMIWELGQDHTPGMPDPLLEAVKEAVAQGSELLGGPVALEKKSQLDRQDACPTTFAGVFTGVTLDSYRVLWSSDLASELWNIMVTTNVSSVGASVQIHDPNVTTNEPQGFYHIETSP